jgi:hypothetical protein
MTRVAMSLRLQRRINEGGLRQLLELLLTGYASVAAYVVLKVCEFALVRQIVDGAAQFDS